MEALSQALSKIPMLFLGIIYIAWVGYDYHDWKTSASSDLGQRYQALANARQNLETHKAKLATAEEFFRNLDLLKARIRQLTVQLESTKTTLSTEVDIANFVRMVTLEAKKLGLVIKGIKPDAEKRGEYYVEVPFTVLLRGAYVQMLVFFDRMAKLQQVVRISDFAMKPSGNVFTKYVELEGSVKLVTYKYLGTQADEISKKDVLKEAGR